MADKSAFLFARVPERDKQIVDEITEHRGENVSDFVRRAVKRELARMGYLTEEEKQALEVTHAPV